MEVKEGSILWLRADANALYPEAFAASGLAKGALNHPVLVLDTFDVSSELVWILLCTSQFCLTRNDIPLATANNSYLFRNGASMVLCNKCDTYHIPLLRNNNSKPRTTSTARSRVPEPLTFEDPNCSMRQFSHLKVGEVFEVDVKMLRSYGDGRGRLMCLDEESMERVRSRVDQLGVMGRKMSRSGSVSPVKEGSSKVGRYLPIAARIIELSESERVKNSVEEDAGGDGGGIRNDEVSEEIRPVLMTPPMGSRNVSVNASSNDIVMTSSSGPPIDEAGTRAEEVRMVTVMTKSVDGRKDEMVKSPDDLISFKNEYETEREGEGDEKDESAVGIGADSLGSVADFNRFESPFIERNPWTKAELEKTVEEETDKSSPIIKDEIPLDATEMIDEGARSHNELIEYWTSVRDKADTLIEKLQEAKRELDAS